MRERGGGGGAVTSDSIPSADISAGDDTALVLMQFEPPANPSSCLVTMHATKGIAAQHSVSHTMWWHQHAQLTSCQAAAVRQHALLTALTLPADLLFLLALAALRALAAAFLLARRSLSSSWALANFILSTARKRLSTK
jgi:hypothetical protein